MNDGHNRCARCGRVHLTTDTMRRIVSYSGRRMVLVCWDDRTCYPVVRQDRRVAR